MFPKEIPNTSRSQSPCGKAPYIHLNQRPLKKPNKQQSKHVLAIQEPIQCSVLLPQGKSKPMQVIFCWYNFLWVQN